MTDHSSDHAERAARTRNPTSHALSHADVRAIRAKLATPCEGCGRPHTFASLAPVYNVSSVTIWKAARGISYKAVE